MGKKENNKGIVEIPTNSVPDKINISPERRSTLEKEYDVAFAMFQMQNSQAWQTFSIVSSIALASLAFVATIRTTGKTTWPISLTMGCGVIIILIGWIILANRWWTYAQTEIYRLMEIEKILDIYLFRQGTWLREPLSKSQLLQLTKEEQNYYNNIHRAFPNFPKYRWRQQNLTKIIVMCLIFIWILFIFMDIYSVI